MWWMYSLTLWRGKAYLSLEYCQFQPRWIAEPCRVEGYKVTHWPPSGRWVSMVNGVVFGTQHWPMSLAVAAARWALVRGTHAQPLSLLPWRLCSRAMCQHWGGQGQLAGIYWQYHFAYSVAQCLLHCECPLENITCGTKIYTHCAHLCTSLSTCLLCSPVCLQSSFSSKSLTNQSSQLPLPMILHPYLSLLFFLHKVDGQLQQPKSASWEEFPWMLSFKVWLMSRVFESVFLWMLY